MSFTVPVHPLVLFRNDAIGNRAAFTIRHIQEKRRVENLFEDPDILEYPLKGSLSGKLVKERKVVQAAIELVVGEGSYCTGGRDGR